MIYPRRTVLLLGATLAATLSLGACGDGGGAPAPPSPIGAISVVTSTNVYGDIAKAVGGSHVAVHAIVSNAGADPHGYEANAQDKLAVSKAQIGIENGGGYDDFFAQLAKGQLGPEQILNVSELSGLDTGPDFNEHLWYSLPTMATLADELATRFSAAAPAEAASFEAQAAAFKEKLQQLEDRVQLVKDAHGGSDIAVTEPVPVYLLEQAGLVNKTPEKFTEAVENGADVPAAVMTDTLSLMASGTMALLANNEQTESPQTIEVKEAAQKAGTPVVDFSETLPAGTSYLDWMTANVAAVEKALGASAPSAAGTADSGATASAAAPAK
ncbi:zinc ABC transporter substrate-binding protein [Arthrobacter sp. H35-D1]|uniref:metal ABC transporter solute-binding protein, Zn/Mn family n=1 Tax=Arthrobacter sp. H35-D1 TaxID=3046202 RepID=UPI0024B87A3D|nr:zinc ABC transporter substrate-binding protein [Arthrobacter sp. H35-D1]MDJ0313030.1 zinc ABC transporter substrate-binding protein [Arthrobacter sp. H35-D1]